MTQQKQIPQILLFIVLVGAIGSFHGCGGNAAKAGTPPAVQTSLTVSSTAVDFGNVTIGSNATKSVTIKNQSTESIVVSSATVNGSAFSMTGATFPTTLAVGSSVTLTLEFAPTTTGSAAGTVVIASNATVAAPMVNLSGAGVASTSSPTLATSKSSIAFGTVNVGTSATSSITLTNSSSTTDIHVSAANVTGTGYTVQGVTLPVTIPASRSQAVTIQFAPTGAGSNPGSVSFVSDATNSPTTVTLTGTGVLPPATLNVNPTSLPFGTVAVGGSKSLTLTLSNPSSTTPITVSSATASGAGYSVSGATYPLTIGAGGTELLTVQFAPTAAGTANGSLVIASDASNPSVSVPLTGTGQAAVAALTVSPTSLTFGTITVGTSSTKSVVLTNNSTNATITVSAATFTGNEYAVSGATFPFTLATGGGSKTLTVTFTPQASGAANDSLSIASNASNSPTAVSVTGAGQAPPAHEVNLSWNASTSPVIGYNVYRSGVHGGPYSILNATLATSAGYTDSNVTAGSTYYYVVTAVDSSNTESKPSNEATATVPSP